MFYENYISVLTIDLGTGKINVERREDLYGYLGGVGVVALSVTTPGLTPMAADGTALGPAILFLDGRSRAQAAAIREAVGEDRFLAEACNLPVSGGSSLDALEAHVLAGNINPQPRSGKQELLENVVNRYV